jgi:hypothetical protein
MRREKVALESLILFGLIGRASGKSSYAHSPILVTAWPPTRLAAPINVGLRSELELRVSRGWLKTQVLGQWVCSTLGAPIVIGRVRYTLRAAAGVDIECGSAEANCWCLPSGGCQQARALRSTVSAPPHCFSRAGNRRYLSLALVRVG